MIHFKPKKEEKVVISMRLNEDMLKRIDTIAHENSMSRNEFLIQAIEFSLTHIKTSAKG